jgi:hypothetical protein
MSAKRKETGLTYYSETIEGHSRNFDLGARFDMSDGFLGISQKEGDKWTERVLLSPAQVQALQNFIAEQRS